MQETHLQTKFKNLFNFHVSGSQLKDDKLIENTQIYILIKEKLINYKPPFESLEIYVFNFALKMISLEFLRGKNQGRFESDAYMKYFKEKISINEGLVEFLVYHKFLPSFGSHRVDINYDELFVANEVTKERLTFKTLETMGFQWFENLLDHEITIIKIALGCHSTRAKIIELLVKEYNAADHKEVEVLFDNLIGIKSDDTLKEI